MHRIVVAIGDTAFPDNQMQSADRIEAASKALVPLIQSDYQVITCHSDVAFVGMVNLVLELDAHNKVLPETPFAECMAMSEGYMGFHLAQALDNLLEKEGSTKTPTIALLTEAIADKEHTQIACIGPYFTKEKAQALMTQTGDSYIEDGPQGWRRTFPTVKPTGFRELGALKALLKDHASLICAGGGGVPLSPTADSYEGVSAIVEIEAAAGLLAKTIDADVLVLISSQADPGTLSIRAAQDMAKNAAGALKKQLEEAASFAQSGRKAVICRLDQIQDALEGKSGLWVQ